MIRIHSRDLMVSPLPEANVLFSQVRVNQKLVAFGSIAQTEIVAPYGDSISVQMGIMPNISGSSLEYRLDHESAWTQLEGYQIAIEGLTPGKYTLHVRPVVNVLGNGAERSLAFVVTEPWYLSALAFVGYITVALVLLFAAVYWRSRMMSSANRRLKAQVALKTNQLRHQSRILLSNNHQLRKQLQVRRLIFSQAIQAFRDRLGNLELKMDREDHQTQMRVVEQISSELELLLNVRESQGQELPAYNLSMIFNSTFIGWQEELAKAGIAVEFQSLPDTDSYVVLDYFNLDILLNLLFDSLVKRCSRHQIVYVELSCTQDDVILTMTDFGAPIERNAQGHWSEVTTLVATSGGRIEVTQQETQNTVHLAWRRSEAFDENSVIALESLALTSVESDSFDPFIKRVEALVMQHFPDADFSTSTAAKMLFVSERSLQRRFKGATQRTFLDYLTEVRLDNACRYLLAGHKVADVAFECGFNDPSYFSQRFKHRFGMSPTQFVEQSDAQHEEVF
ncbi:DNA-binding response regulator AraC family [Vibrio ponticus]|nr:DNA-binding response regulator AraC family [Vibrio ponticus]